MKLKQITKLLFAISLTLALGSCNSDDSTEYTSETSADAQIYSFKLSTNKATDSVNYLAIGKAVFAIDQRNIYIYNPDSLPVGTKLAKYRVTMNFVASIPPSKVQLVYPKDSIVDWTVDTDSVDFSIPNYPKIRVTANNGLKSNEYTLDLRIHKVDPDSIIWSPITSMNNTTIGLQKTLLRVDKSGVIEKPTFYTFSKDIGGGLYLHLADKATATYKARQAISGLAASSIVLESITLFNDEFYALDNNNQSYTSEDGLNWTPTKSGVFNILGILPVKDKAAHTMLLIVNDGGVKKFATTKDLQTVSIIDPSEVAIPERFPISSYSSVTSHDQNNADQNILTLTGGRVSDGAETNLTWFLKLGNNGKLQVASNQPHTVFVAKAGITCFLYDSYMYALTGNQFYKSSSWGSKWVKTTSKEALYSDIPKAFGQSVVVDSDNYIWLFGGQSDLGNNPVQKVWRGRLNKLNPK